MEGSVDLIRIWKIMKRNLILLLIFPIIGLIIAILISIFLIKPQYQANTQVLVNEKDSSEQARAQQVQSNIQLVNTYAEIVKSPRISEKVSKEFKGAYSPKELSGMLAATNQTESQVLNITITSGSKSDSEKIANKYAEVFSDEIPDIMSVDNVSILSSADGTGKQVEPKIMVNSVLGLVLGLIVSIVIIVLKELFDRRIKTEQDVEEELNLPVLGSIQKF